MLRPFRSYPTLGDEATKPATADFLQYLERFDVVSPVYNKMRSHQALGGTSVWCKFSERMAMIAHVCSSPNR